MTPDTRQFADRFPRSARYNPDWLLASASVGANPFWLTEWLFESIDLKPGQRVSISAAAARHH